MKPQTVFEKLPVNIQLEVKQLISSGALFVVNHSGGKDSQALYAFIAGIVPHRQIAVVHADLGDVEWLGAKNHIVENIRHPLHVAKPIWKDGSPKYLLDMVRRRHEKLVAQGRDASPWPDKGNRFCTSDLKRDPCNKVIRRLSKESGRAVIVSCFGFRAEESTDRARKQVLAKDNRNNGKAGRTWYEFSPLHSLTVGQVFETISDAGQTPHWCYAEGNTRMSCVFCVFGAKADWRNGAQHHPDLASEYMAIERDTGKTIRRDETMAQIIGAAPQAVA